MLIYWKGLSTIQKNTIYYEIRFHKLGCRSIVNYITWFWCRISGQKGFSRWMTVKRKFADRFRVPCSVWLPRTNCCYDHKVSWRSISLIKGEVHSSFSLKRDLVEECQEWGIGQLSSFWGLVNYRYGTF